MTRSPSTARELEEAPLLGGTDDNGSQTSTLPEVSFGIKQRLYVSHFLSTWNSRVFEFGAVLYLAAVFPNTLLPMSVYAFTRGAAAILLSPAVGRYIDMGNRLQVVRLSIVLQRLAVAASCVTFWFLASGWHRSRGLTWGLLAVLALLACIEKLTSVTNLVSVEKDWVVVIAKKNETALRELNAQMRRIDLICKLGGPFFISMIAGISTEIAIIVNFGMNVASIVVEYFAIARVYKIVPTLQDPKQQAGDRRASAEQAQSMTKWSGIKGAFLGYARDMSKYCHHRAFLPSFSGAILYFTVLNFAGRMVTYLLASGYNSFHVGAARTLSVVFEIAATWTAPLSMSKVGPIRAGIWSVNLQLFCLAGAAGLFWGAQDPIIAATGLVVGTILSRVGLRGFDLCAQIIVQELTCFWYQEVEAESRGSFSALEASWQNFFEMCSYSSTIIFFRPEQFQWPVLMSCIAVFMAAVLYTYFVRSRRGHLLHVSACIDRKNNKRRLPGPESERLLQGRSELSASVEAAV
ncbi:iron-regulated transporter [Zopfia rhizophila CBS 207.26]|uniref:Solute carrier family 40 member n=1 Tax=Zopfia rhizophila CBS 207.26 TaxID=1314779 RepID=A0A6A6ED99_9PEZI|nr:iron-regulated transporter [Zopfia rhizophila CBS 207.26]